MGELKKQAEELGVKVDGRWSAERLQAEIDEALAKDPVEADEPSLVDDLPEVPAEPEVEVPVPEVDLLAKGNAEILAAIEARAPADGRASDDVEPVEPSITVINLQANPMKVLRLASYGEATFTQAELSRDPLLVKKLERAELLGLVKIEGK